MKLIIDIPDEDYKFIKEMRHLMGGRGSCKTLGYNELRYLIESSGRWETIQPHMIDAIKSGRIVPDGLQVNKYYTRLDLIDFLSFLYDRQKYTNEHKDGDGWSMADLIYLADEYCEGLNNETQN